MAKRSRLQIINDMLSTLEQAGGSIKATHLMYKSNLSHGQMQGYLDEFEEKGYVVRETKGRSKRIVITQLGRDFLLKLRELSAFEESFGL